MPMPEPDFIDGRAQYGDAVVERHEHRAQPSHIDGRRPDAERRDALVSKPYPGNSHA